MNQPLPPDPYDRLEPDNTHQRRYEEMPVTPQRNYNFTPFFIIVGTIVVGIALIWGILVIVSHFLNNLP